MTIEVLIGIRGNKAVKVVTPDGDMVLKPGRYMTTPLSGAQSLTIQETGEFVDPGPAATRLPPPEKSAV